MKIPKTALGLDPPLKRQEMPGFGLRLRLGLVFISSNIRKLNEPSQSRQRAKTYQITPNRAKVTTFGILNYFLILWPNRPFFGHFSLEKKLLAFQKANFHKGAKSFRCRPYSLCCFWHFFEKAQNTIKMQKNSKKSPK